MIGQPPNLLPGLGARVDQLVRETQLTSARAEELAALVKGVTPAKDRLDIFHGYIGVFLVAFFVALVMTPVMRRLALSNGVIDRPSEARKVHRLPVAYLGGVAVYLGIMSGVLFSYVAPMWGLIESHVVPQAGETVELTMVPLSVLLGMTVIMVIGMWDDVAGISPRLKVAGQLLAAAALALEKVGVQVAKGLLQPIADFLGRPDLIYSVPIPFTGAVAELDVVYWVGTAIIAVGVLGACNASNLIDGLDGLLSGTTAITSIGLLFIALTLAMVNDGRLDTARIVLVLALLGGCLGFLPHNFNPAVIFLGDAGSLLLGYVTIVIVLTLGDTGKTQWVLAGLIAYALPIIDTTLAIIRRKMSGKRISDPDDQHLHHMLKRALGVKGAVFALYGIASVFAVLGCVLFLSRGRVVYTLVAVFASFICVTAIKIARRKQLEEQAVRLSGTPVQVPPAPVSGGAAVASSSV